MPPKVSICLPNLNNKQYLQERLDTIFSQTLQNWELIVVDGFSNDGAWEFFQRYAKHDPRITLFQEPPEGIYASINSCIKKAKGEYIYIATSDDTMHPTCLEKMVEALEEFSDCEICQCCLEIIDEASQPMQNITWNKFGLAKYLGPYFYQKHKRLAPHDGILHFALGTVYTSLTQLLIRTRLFESIGYFKEGIGAPADFEWAMRASLLYNTIYIPETLATWRIHDDQATQTSNSQNFLLLLQMSYQALMFAKARESVQLKSLSYSRLSYPYRQRLIGTKINKRNNNITKIITTLFLLCQYPLATIYYIYGKLFKQSVWDKGIIIWISKTLEELKINKPITFDT